MSTMRTIAAMAVTGGLLAGLSRADTPKEDLPKEGPPTKAQLKKSENNLKIIALAMHNFHDTYNGFPAAAICDKDGKPLLSWRVAILPFIEEDKLYREFKLDEPWDSDHNKKLLARMPKVYAPVRGKTKDGDETYYRVFVGNGAIFDLKNRTKISSILDGTANTIMVVEAGESVPWTKPDELTYDPKKKLPALGGMFDGDFHAAFADGVVRLFRKGKKEETLHKMIDARDGQVIEEDEFKP